MYLEINLHISIKCYNSVLKNFHCWIYWTFPCLFTVNFSPIISTCFYLFINCTFQKNFSVLANDIIRRLPTLINQFFLQFYYNFHVILFLFQNIIHSKFVNFAIKLCLNKLSCMWGAWNYKMRNSINDIKQISVKIVVVRKTYHAFLSL